MYSMFAHFEDEQPDIRISEQHTEFGDTPYRVVTIGSMSLFMNEDQLDQLAQLITQRGVVNA